MLIALLVVAVRRAPSAEDVEEETERQHGVPPRPGYGTLVGTALTPLTSTRPDRTRSGPVAREMREPL